MANNRVAIRAALKALLSGETDAGTNVYTNRESRLWKSELPSIIINTPDEPVNIRALNGGIYNRTLTINVEVKVEASEDVDDTLDALLAEVEQIVADNPSLSGTVQAAIQTNTETRIDSEAEKDIGVGILTFECKYSS